MNDIDEAFSRLKQEYIAAVASRNVNALVQLYDPNVRIFDSWGVWEYNGAESWRTAVEGWLTSNPTDNLLVSFDECTVLGSMEFATMTAIVTYSGIAADGKESQSMQNRITWIAGASGDTMRIIHEHTSAPIGFEDMKAILKRQVNRA